MVGRSGVFEKKQRELVKLITWIQADKRVINGLIESDLADFIGDQQSDHRASAPGVRWYFCSGVLDQSLRDSA